MITTQDTDVDRARAGLDAIQARIDALIEERAALMTTAQAELVAAGVDSHVVPRFTLGSLHPAADRYYYVTDYRAGSRYVGQTLSPVRDDHAHAPVGPHTWSKGMLHIAHGTYSILLRDVDSLLIARIPDADDDERGHRLAVSRLRTLARKDDMRVQVSDRDITLVDPMETVVHEGTVVTAFAFLLGIELEH